MVNIYKLIHPDTLEIRYVGKTNESLKRRFNKHINNRMNNSKVNKWIRSLIKNKKYPIIKLIEKVSFEIWEEKEIYWIKYYKDKGFNLMYITIGGDCGSLGYKHTKEAKQRISILNSRPKSKEWIENAAREMTKTVSTPIIQYDKEMNFIKNWNSFCFAAKEIRPNNYKAAIKNIHTCCKLKRKSVYNYIWRYKSIESKDKEL